MAGATRRGLRRTFEQLRHASTSAISPADLGPSPFKTLTSLLTSRSLSAAESSGLLTWSTAEKADFLARAAEAEQAATAAATEALSTGRKASKDAVWDRKGRLNWRKLRYMTVEDRGKVVVEELKRVEARSRADAEGGEGVEQEVQREEETHPAVLALRLPEGVAEVTLELAARDADDLATQDRPWSAFGAVHLPLLIWANPSVAFKVSFARSQDRLVVVSRDRSTAIEIPPTVSALALLSATVTGAFPAVQSSLSQPPTVDETQAAPDA